MNAPSEHLPSTNGDHAPSANGDLVNRVQQLRLDGQLGTGQPRSAGGGSWLPWVLCALLAFSWVGVGVRWYRTAATNPARPEGAAAPAVPVGEAASRTPSASSQSPAPSPGEILLQLKGNLIPSLQIAVSPRDVAGELTAITFWEGKLVKKNDTLATILDSQYRNRFTSDQAAVLSMEAQEAKAEAAEAASRARVAKSESALASARARATKALANQDRAHKDYEQAKQQRAGRAISAQEYQKFEADKLAADADQVATDADVEAARREVEATQADVTTAGAAVRAAKAEVGAAKARRDESRRLLDNCTVVAPITGTVLTKKADVGSLVSPAAFNVAASLCEIADLSKLEVEIDVPERQITKIRPNLDCQIAADADTNRMYRGYVHRVMPIADDSKSVVKVRVRVFLPKGETPGSFLKPKMSVVVTAYSRDFTPAPTDQPWE